MSATQTTLKGETMFAIPFTNNGGREEHRLIVNQHKGSLRHGQNVSWTIVLNVRSNQHRYSFSGVSSPHEMLKTVYQYYGGDRHNIAMHEFAKEWDREAVWTA